MEVSVLASSSSGNCFYVGNGKNGLLIDAGISLKQISSRLNKIGKNIDDIKGILVTHEHYDHISGIQMLSRKHNIPVYVNKGTLWNSYTDMGNIQLMRSDEDFELYGMKILPFRKCHDAHDPLGFTISHKGKKISVMTDLGKSCENTAENLKNSNLVILESNYDVNMLKKSLYPNHLKKRIMGKEGHLSNYDAALMVLEHGKKKLQQVLLSHLSQSNNTPELALNTFNSIVGERKDLRNLKTVLTYKERPTQIIRL